MSFCRASYDDNAKFCDPVLSVDRPRSLEMDIKIDLSLKLCHI